MTNDSMVGVSSNQGIFTIPTALKRNHVSAAHTQDDIDLTSETARGVLRAMPAGIA